MNSLFTGHVGLRIVKSNQDFEKGLHWSTKWSLARAVEYENIRLLVNQANVNGILIGSELVNKLAHKIITAIDES